MSISFLTPLAALVGLLVALPLAAMALADARARRVRRALLLEDPRSPRWPYALAICAFAALVAVGAAQPNVERESERRARADAEAFFVFDTSRSMLARRAPGSPTRLDRARSAGKRLRSELPEVPVGIASFTDRVLPHLLPSISGQAFTDTLDGAIGVDRPPPLQRNRLATSLGTLSGLATARFFTSLSKRRLVVVFTDGESRPFNARQLRRTFTRARVDLIVVHVWAQDEQIFARNGAPETAYQPDAGSVQTVDRFAAAVRGSAFAETELDEALEAARRALGSGELAVRGEEVSATSLAPYLFLSAFVPLGFLLWKRNL